jgi:secreted trypsin-like serine protease
MKTNLLKIGGTLLSVALLTSCGQRNAPSEGGLFADNIVGGVGMNETAQKEAGVVGLVIITDEGTGTCTGSLIANRLVLTAAHCLEGSVRKVFAVFTSDFSKATAANVRAGVSGQAHEGFAPSLNAAWNDIALVKLAADAPADFKKVRLATTATDAALKAGTKVTQMGFGRGEDRNVAADTSGVLRSINNIPLLKKSRDGKELHFTEAGRGSCNGDSGGPALLRDRSGLITQVGVNSRGTLQNSCLGVGIYTNVAAHAEWIRTTAAKLNTPPARAPAQSSGESLPAKPNSDLPSDLI